MAGKTLMKILHEWKMLQSVCSSRNERWVGWLKTWLFSAKFRPEHTKHREGDIDCTHGEHDDVANDLHLGNMLCGNAKNGRDLLPSEACVRNKHTSAEDVEESPNIARTVEELILKLVNVAHGHWCHTSVPGPEELQFGDAIPADQQGGWAKEVLPSVPEAELEEVNGHEREEHHSRDCKFHLVEGFALFASSPIVGNGFSLVPSALEPTKT